MGVRDSVVSSELGTETNLIVVGDELTPLGSASKPIVIHVGENWRYDEINHLSSYANPMQTGATLLPPRARSPMKYMLRMILSHLARLPMIDTMRIQRS